MVIRIYKPPPLGIIVSTLQIVPPGLSIIVVTTVSERIIVSTSGGELGGIAFCAVAPCVVGVPPGGRLVPQGAPIWIGGVRVTSFIFHYEVITKKNQSRH